MQRSSLAPVALPLLGVFLVGIAPCEERPADPHDPHDPPPATGPRDEAPERPGAPDARAGERPDLSHVRLAVVADPPPGYDESSLHAYGLTSVDTSLEVGGRPVTDLVSRTTDALSALPQPVVGSVTRVLIVESGDSVGALPEGPAGVFRFESPDGSGRAIPGGTMYLNLAEIDDGEGPFGDEMRRTVQHEAAHLHHAYLEGFDRTYEAFRDRDLGPMLDGPIVTAWNELAGRQCREGGEMLPYYAEGLTDEEARSRGFGRGYAAENVVIDKIAFLVRRGFLCEETLHDHLGLTLDELHGLRDGAEGADACDCIGPPDDIGRCDSGCYLDSETETCKPCCYEPRIGNYCNGPFCPEGVCYGPWCVD